MASLNVMAVETVEVIFSRDEWYDRRDILLAILRKENLPYDVYKVSDTVCCKFTTCSSYVTNRLAEEMRNDGINIA